MRDIDLYQMLLGLTPPWRVTVVDVHPDPKLREITIRVEYPRGELLQCPECEQVCPGYDRKVRRWRHLNTMQFKTIIESEVPRVECPTHGVKSIGVPWAEDRSRFTALFEAYAINVLLAVRSKVQAEELAEISWDQVDLIMDRAVARGMDRREIEKLRYCGIDEKSFGKGHNYASILHDLEGKRVLEVVHTRTTEAASELWQRIPEQQRKQIEAVAMDMWQPYMESTATHVPQADIVHDKFHCVKELKTAVDSVRKKEHKILKAENGGESVLNKTKYLWLTNSKNWSDAQRAQFAEMKIDILQVGRAWSIAQAFEDFWAYRYAGSARKFFDRWYFWATHSRLQPVIDAAKTLKRHLPGLLAYCKHRITNAAAEGTNSKIQLIKANARGFRNFEKYRIAILFHCGRLDLYPLKSR
jgi:transposase